ncbi:hypothetical protein DAEQUDRAFT_499483 [Daedalea quercina L-15889]|uniref:Uncharacterized protein n=1 Tax=Daedalea quercina L-15889 TaxID=1314783 RepID=A0A165MJI3_9APHY|nr:hypothetical protein DAEQUDRAFT_499483 [Daedalea quercina L-15889]
MDRLTSWSACRAITSSQYSLLINCTLVCATGCDTVRVASRVSTRRRFTQHIAIRHRLFAPRISNSRLYHQASANVKVDCANGESIFCTREHSADPGLSRITANVVIKIKLDTNIALLKLITHINIMKFIACKSKDGMQSQQDIKVSYKVSVSRRSRYMVLFTCWAWLRTRQDSKANLQYVNSNIPRSATQQKAIKKST